MSLSVLSLLVASASSPVSHYTDARVKQNDANRPDVAVPTRTVVVVVVVD
jgi:hypothetical protein